MAKRKVTLCQQRNNYQGGRRLRYSWPNFPEDVWGHIHSLMPLRDAARAACVSHTFLCSWRCHPNLIFSKRTLGLEHNSCRKSEISRAFTSIVDRILKNHSGNGIKTLNLDIFDCPNLNTCDLNNWLQNAIKPGIEEISLVLPWKYRKLYSFPCSLLFGGSGRSLQYLDIKGCAFRPMVGLCLRSLTKLCLCQVRITGDELGCLLINSLALKELELYKCSDIICLKVPLLEQLSNLDVCACKMLQMIEIKAMNLSTFNFTGNLVQFSVGESLKVKDLNMDCLNKSDFICYAITNLPYVVPNVETLTLYSISERVDTPMMTEHKKHKCLKNLTMMGFCSAKSMVELTCYILKNTESLQCITLDTIANWPEDENGFIGRCCVRRTKRRECLSIGKVMILEAHKALLAIERYILDEIPAAVRLNVHRPCTRCHKLYSS
uniref:F-box domain-containing protein n=1 Tax=Leersia perrieri TaxID=77586 RepID=A0A0D9VFZ5_9ORYZ